MRARGVVPVLLGLFSLLPFTLPAAAGVPQFSATDATSAGQVDEGLIPHVPLTRSAQVTVQGHAFLPVRFVQDVKFSASGAAPHPTVQLEGGGGFAGIALVQDSGESPAALLAGRIDPLLTCANRCLPGSGGVVVRSQGLVRDGDTPTSAHVIPAGTYRLYILSGAGPVTVRLTFPELPGTGEPQELLAYTYTGAVVRLPGNRAPVEQQKSLYYAGESNALTATGLLFTYVEVVGQESHLGTIYTCHYEDPEPEALAYAPKCPGGSADASDPSLNPTPAPVGYRITRHAFRANVAPGTYGLGGGYFTASNSIETANTAVVWLSY